jgi:hypothetical protein
MRVTSVFITRGRCRGDAKQRWFWCKDCFKVVLVYMRVEAVCFSFSFEKLTSFIPPHGCKGFQLLFLIAFYAAY